MKNEYVVFILSNRRPDRVHTYETLRRSGYTGRIFILVDDLDPTVDDYLKRFPDELIVFSKAAAGKITDPGDNFEGLRGVVYARNFCFEIAKGIGVKYFIQLDDDYRHFQFRFNKNFAYQPKVIKTLGPIFDALVHFYTNSPITTLAIAQGGDFIGGDEAAMAGSVCLKRKAMNLFVCSTDRPFKFYGRINEDTTAYTLLGSLGKLFFTTNQLTLEQVQTQSNAGGLTELYLDAGTYVKSFYSVIFQPSSVRVGVIRGQRGTRLHHQVEWKSTAPMILRESFRKASSSSNKEGAR